MDGPLVLRIEPKVLKAFDANGDDGGTFAGSVAGWSIVPRQWRCAGRQGALADGRDRSGDAGMVAMAKTAWLLLLLLGSRRAGAAAR